MATKVKSTQRTAKNDHRKRKAEPAVTVFARSGEAKSLGRFIETNPRVQGGEPVFKGTRIMAQDALELLAEGCTLDEIPTMWRSGRVTRAAVVEAVELAIAAFVQVYSPPPPADE